MSGSIVEEVEDPDESEGIGKVASDGDPADGSLKDGDESGVILLARSNALAKACILPKRRCGSFSSAVSTTCSSVSKTVGSQTSYFLYDGGTLLATLDGGGNISRAYSWGQDGLIADSSADGERFYSFDPFGSVSGSVSQ